MPAQNKKPTYWNRFRRYPLSCLGHTVQGLVAGLLLMPGENSIFAFASVVWAYLFVKYQELSMERKAINTGRADTGGLDVQDFLVGYAFALVVITAGGDWMPTGSLPQVIRTLAAIII